MGRILWVFVVLVGFAGMAEAQGSATNSSINQLSNKTVWDVGSSIGLLSANPLPSNQPYSSDWYFSGRYAVSIGRYWTDHLKTELEFVTSNQTERYVPRVSNTPGVPPAYTYTARERHTLRQVSGRPYSEKLVAVLR